MPLDPQAETLLQAMAAAGVLLDTSLPVADQRRLLDSRTVFRAEDSTLPGAAGPIPVRIFLPPGPRPLPVLVYFHGGGWVIGSLDGYDSRCRLLAEWGGCAVVSVDYRMAPEYPFPAAVDDAYAATCWIAEHAPDFGGDPRRVAVGGDSAGGNLATVVAMLARDKGGPRLTFQCLVYPVTDTDTETRSYMENAVGYNLTRDAMRWFIEQYVPDPAQRKNPLVAPLRSADLSRLPPALVITAEYDPLRDEGEAYAFALEKAGVKVELRRYDGMFHGFWGMSAVLDQGKQAIQDAGVALRCALGLVASRALDAGSRTRGR